MAVNDDYERHLQGWLGFGRLLRWAVTGIIVILILMAYFLL
ncbi:MAG TPA: aa3-type cytochrome c oxidase subunit IV [Stellaceae bacterium]|nr:aa3-type cytochrome c oxidase subunit IV [Stellaceae bacterium]